jgi:membrane-bound lytic murein transglycosylase B
MKILITVILFTSIIIGADNQKQVIPKPENYIVDAFRWFIDIFNNNANKFDSLKIVRFSPAAEKLLLKGADSAFVYRMILDDRTTYNPKFAKITVYRSPSTMREYTVESSSNKYSGNYNNSALGKSESFIETHFNTLKKAEEIYKVPVEVISSILWIETRHGSFTGNNHVISVYLNLALADQPEFLDMNRESMLEKYSRNKSELPTLEKKLQERSEEKSEWAIDQLLALEKMSHNSPYNVFELEGSYAGAFGMPQFIPTSYISWAVDGNGDGKINLYEADDAIFSVANYLKTNGWGQTEKEQRTAVFHYNRSNEYVDAVLIHAKKLMERD